MIYGSDVNCANESSDFKLTRKTTFNVSTRHSKRYRSNDHANIDISSHTDKSLSADSKQEELSQARFSHPGELSVEPIYFSCFRYVMPASIIFGCRSLAPMLKIATVGSNYTTVISMY